MKTASLQGMTDLNDAKIVVEIKTIKSNSPSSCSPGLQSIMANQAVKLACETTSLL